MRPKHRHYRCSRLSSRRGSILLPTIILISFAATVTYGVTTYIVEQLSLRNIQYIQLRTRYLAQAGAHRALYDYRDRAQSATGYITHGQTNVDTGEYFVIGGTQADMLKVDVSQAVKGGSIDPDDCRIIGDACEADCWVIEDECDQACDDEEDDCVDDAYVIYQACLAGCAPGKAGKSCRKACDRAYHQDQQDCHHANQSCKQNCTFERQTCRTECQDGEEACIAGDKLTYVYLQNATNSSAITIDQMIVSWDDTNISLSEIVINVTLLWSGTAGSSATADLSPDFTLAADQTLYEMDYMQFTDSMADATYCDVTFVMGDASTKTVRIIPQSNNFNFTVKSTGKTSASSIYSTVAAEYNTLTSGVADYYETTTEITP